jgi:hypothetical protein
MKSRSISAASWVLGLLSIGWTGGPAARAEEVVPKMTAVERGVIELSASADSTRILASTATEMLTLNAEGDVVHRQALDTGTVAIPLVGPAGSYLGKGYDGNAVLYGPGNVRIRALRLGSGVVAVGAGGQIYSAETGGDHFGRIFSRTGARLKPFGHDVSFKDGTKARRDTMNTGLVAANPSGGFYFVTRHRPEPVAYRFSDLGELIGSFPLASSAIDDLREAAQRSLETNRGQCVGGIVVISAITVDPRTGNLWISVPASTETGVLVQYSPDGTKLGEYRLPQMAAGHLLLLDRVVATRDAFLAVASGSLYRIPRKDLEPTVGWLLAARKPVDRLLELVTPTVQAADCPLEQGWGGCAYSCPGAPLVDCKADLEAQVSQRVVGNTCNITPGSNKCVASVTQCNESTGVQTTLNTQINCNSPDVDGDGYTVAQGDCNDNLACANPGAWAAGMYCDVGACDGDDDDCNGQSDQVQCNGSPILIDMNGDGFHLTDNFEPVRFDLNGDQVKESWSWTRANDEDGWLALDRDGNGTIDSGLELFGNWTDQDRSAEPNGFRALREFDKRANGGNADGWIDVSDRIFLDLRIWSDRNRNGVSEIGELRPLQADARLSLDYWVSRRTDEHGNRFTYWAPIEEFGPGKAATDVFLVCGE